jgi:hypothetical protein
MRDLTICSVYHRKETRDLILLNHKLTRALNTNASIRWVVVDNSPHTARVSPPGEDIEVLKGFEISDFERMYAKPIVYAYHAASALNRVLPHCDTRYVLFLDADFFIVRPNWIHDVLSFMLDRGIVAFGSPWHPQYSGKIRYLPTHHCLFVDTSRIPVMELDFQPDYPFASTHLSTNPSGSFPVRRPHMSSILGKFVSTIMDRWHVGSSRDLSYRVARLLRESSLPVGLLQPVWKPKDHGHALSQFVDACLPERFAMMPKQRGFFSLTGFKETGRHDFYAEMMEEYLWQGHPFAVHIRNTSKRQDFADMLLGLEKKLFSAANTRVD